MLSLTISIMNNICITNFHVTTNNVHVQEDILTCICTCLWVYVYVRKYMGAC